MDFRRCDWRDQKGHSGSVPVEQVMDGLHHRWMVDLANLRLNRRQNQPPTCPVTEGAAASPTRALPHRGWRIVVCSPEKS